MVGGFFVMRQPVRKVMKTALLRACTKKSELKCLSLYQSEKLTEQKIAAFKNKIEKALSQWKT